MRYTLPALEILAYGKFAPDDATSDYKGKLFLLLV
jgi:hypothetical protein